MAVASSWPNSSRPARTSTAPKVRSRPYVLPPRRPQWNGCVERANDSTRVEFWTLYDGDFTVAVASNALAGYQNFHSHVRPNQALDWKTPNEDFRNAKGCPSQFHILRIHTSFSQTTKN